MKNKFPVPVCFLDGFQPRHGVAVAECGGVWTVHCDGEILTMWQDDIFLSPADAQHAINTLLN